MLRIQKASNPPRIKPVAMSCDKPLSTSIPDPLPNTCFRMLIIGAPSSGKSSLATGLLIKGGPYYRVFDRLYIIQPENSRASYTKDPWSKHNRVYNELTVEILQKILDETAVLADEGKHSLVFIDDQAFALKDKKIEKLLRVMFFNARHRKLSTICVSQTLRQVPINLRKTASHLLTFVPANRIESKIIAEENLFLDTQTAARLFEQVFTKRFDHLLIDTQKRRAFSNFNEIELPRSF